MNKDAFSSPKLLDQWVDRNRTYRLESWESMCVWFCSLAFFHFILLMKYEIFQSGAGFTYSLSAFTFCILYSMFSIFRYHAEWKRIAVKYWSEQ